MEYYSGVNILFKIYKDATLFFSQDKVSSIANLIPTMDRIDALLSDVPAEPLSQSVKHALTFARKSINKYYSKMDLSNVYRIAMGEYLDKLLLRLLILFHISVLHPQLKLKYFQQRHWAQDWIDTAETIVREEFEKYDTRPTLGPVLSVPEVDDIEATTDFLDIPMDGLKEISELDDYLSQPIEKVTDPIKWWWDHRKVFPKLSGMAFDFLSVPGTFYLMFLFKFSLIMFISDIYCR